MKTPREKYQADPEYHNLVDTLESLIRHARFTPSELREACIMAHYNYEVSRPHATVLFNKETVAALQTLSNFINTSTQETKNELR